MSAAAVQRRFPTAVPGTPAKEAPFDTTVLALENFRIEGARFTVRFNFRQDRLSTVALYARDLAAPDALFADLERALMTKYGKMTTATADSNGSLTAPVYDDTPWRVGRFRSLLAEWHVGRTTIRLLKVGDTIHLLYDAAPGSAGGGL